MPGEIINLAKQVLQDLEGGYSSKRLIVFLAFILMAIAFLANMFFGYNITEFIFNAMLYIVLGGLGLATGERFTKVIGNKINPPTGPKDE